VVDVESCECLDDLLDQADMAASSDTTIQLLIDGSTRQSSQFTEHDSLFETRALRFLRAQGPSQLVSHS